jgi:hypothetical protein
MIQCRVSIWGCKGDYKKFIQWSSLLWPHPSETGSNSPVTRTLINTFIYIYIYLSPGFLQAAVPSLLTGCNVNAKPACAPRDSWVQVIERLVATLQENVKANSNSYSPCAYIYLSEYNKLLGSWETWCPGRRTCPDLRSVEDYKLKHDSSEERDILTESSFPQYSASWFLDEFPIPAGIRKEGG